MAQVFNEVYDLFPKFDCGLCGNPSCRAMARRVILHYGKPEDCSILLNPSYGENLKALRSILRKGFEVKGVGATVAPLGAGITYVHPCISEVGKVMAEARLASPSQEGANPIFGLYDARALCWALERSGPFEDSRCSPGLGVARLSMEGKTVMVFKDGKVNIRGAEDGEDALESIRLISRSLWGAIICPRCGNVGFDCASGGCDECLTDGCPIVDKGPPDPRSGGWKEARGERTGRRVLEAPRILQTWRRFEDGFGRLDEAMKLLLSLGDDIARKGSWEGGLRALKNVEVLILEVERLATRVMVENPEALDATVGLILAGVALGVSRMAEGLRTLFKTGLGRSLSPRTLGLLREALSIAEGGYRSLRTEGEGLGPRVFDAYRVFRESLVEILYRSSGTEGGLEVERDTLLSIEKLAFNGFRMARLSTKGFVLSRSPDVH